MLVRSWNIMSGWTKHTTVHEFNALFPGLSKFNFLNRGETDLWKETSDYIVITSLFQITYLEVGDRTSGSANRYRSVTIETALRSLLWSAESLDSNSQWGKRQRLMVHLDSPLNLQCYLLYHHSQVSQHCVSQVMYRIFLSVHSQVLTAASICIESHSRTFPDSTWSEIKGEWWHLLLPCLLWAIKVVVALLMPRTSKGGTHCT